WICRVKYKKKASRCWLSYGLNLDLELALNIVFNPNTFNQVDLCGSPVQIVFFFFQNFLNQITGYIIHFSFSQRYCFLDGFDIFFDLTHITMQHFLSMMADIQFAQMLQIRQTF